MVDVLKIHKIDSPGPLKAFISVRVDGIIFHEFRLIQKDTNKGFWVSAPSITIKDKITGKIHYKALVQFPESLYSQISTKILKEFNDRNYAGAERTI